MGGDAAGRRHAIIAGINVTPLVDITLVLLIIFIVTARILVTPAVTVDLPRASRTEEVQVVFSVIVTRDGGILVNGTHVASDEAFRQRARDEASRDRDLRAVIHADGALPHRRVIRVLDLLKQAGVSHIAFAALALHDDDERPDE